MFIIRCRDNLGTKRFPLEDLNISVGELEKIIISSNSTNVNPSSYLSLSPSPNDPPLLKEEKLSNLSLQMGHLFFLHNNGSSATSTTVTPQSKEIGNSLIPPSLQECYDAIKQGKGRKKSSKPNLGPNCLRSHGPKGMCPTCKPKELWELAKEMGVKHTSINVYYQEQLEKFGKTFTFPNETTSSSSTTITTKCKHPPQNKCTHCTGSQLTNLQRQPYRIIDHVEFLSPLLVENFLRDGWRKDALQHMAWIYGYYQLMEHKDDPPLGIKATAIFLHHSMKQKNFLDGFSIEKNDSSSSDDDDDDDEVEKIMLEMFGLEKIGIIYTDLKEKKTDDHGDGSGSVGIGGGGGNDSSSNSLSDGRVLPGRSTLSGSEFLFIAQEQLRHRAPSPIVNSNVNATLGSPFVTVIISGDKEGQISLEAYQASTQCSMLIENGIIQACYELDLMSKVGSNGYEIIYAGVDGNVRADPTFPVDYFLVSLTTAFKDVGDDVLSSDSSLSIIENDTKSLLLASLAPQVPSNIRSYLFPLPQDEERRIKLLKNMNLFIHLQRQLEKEELLLLSYLIRNNDKRILSSNWWNGIMEEMTLINVSSESMMTMTDGASPIQCIHCTFLNENGGDSDGMCEMCGLPLR